MNRIEEKFRELKAKNRKAFIAYIMAGDPDLETSYELVLELEKQGVDIIELGVPFSDPIADGPTIQKAGQRALKNDINLNQILGLIHCIREKSEIPIIAMTYFNILFRYGIDKFVKIAQNKGIDGVIIPDLIPEEADVLIRLGRRFDFSTIFLVSPTSNLERLKKIVRSAEGFIYYVSLTGVTGARSLLPAKLKENVLRIKKLTAKPVCVGFGISRQEQVREILKFSDGVVVGSAIINVLERNLGRGDLVKRVGSFIASLLM